jgi:hypothetical protein
MDRVLPETTEARAAVFGFSCHERSQVGKGNVSSQREKKTKNQQSMDLEREGRKPHS